MTTPPQAGSEATPEKGSKAYETALLRQRYSDLRAAVIRDAGVRVGSHAEGLEAEVTDILSLIDNAVQDHETSCDAMRWSPEPPEVPKRQGHSASLSAFDEAHYAPTPSHRRVIHGPRPGMRLVPFVGGPWHGDLRALPPAFDYRHVLAPVLPATPGYITYTLVAGWVDVPHGAVDGAPPGGWHGRIRAARAPDATEADLNEVLSGLLFAGWQPWLPPGSQPCVGEARR
jgi:hypothetical protein